MENIHSLNKRIVLIFMGLVLIAHYFISLDLFNYKLISLSFHTRDFAYYMQFFFKSFAELMGDKFSLNPEGFNVFGFFGIDGEKNIHQDIHFSPFKYILAGIYSFSRSEYVLYTVFYLIHILPVIFIITLFIKNRIVPVLALIMLVSYLSIPSLMSGLQYDFRMYALLAPLLVLSILLVVYERPFKELFFISLFILSVREEGAIFLLVVCLHLVMYSRIKDALRLLVLADIWIGLSFVYFFSTDFSLKLNLGSLMLCIGLNLAALLMAYRPVFIQRLIALKPAYFLVYLAPFAMQFGLSHQSEIKGVATGNDFLLNLFEIFNSLTFDPRWLPVWFILVLVLPIVVLKNKDVFNKTTLSIIVLVCVSMLYININNINSSLSKYKASYIFTKLVWDAKKSIDNDSVVLCDYETYQAFYDIRDVYVYERMPSNIVSGESRYYPENSQYVSKLLKNDIDYIVISQSSYDEVSSLVGGLGDVINVSTISSNEKYVILKIIRSNI